MVSGDDEVSHSTHVVDACFVVGSVFPLGLLVSPVNQSHFSVMAAVKDSVLVGPRHSPGLLSHLEVQCIGVVSKIQKANILLIGHGDGVRVEGRNLEDVSFAADGRDLLRGS